MAHPHPYNVREYSARGKTLLSMRMLTWHEAEVLSEELARRMTVPGSKVVMTNYPQNLARVFYRGPKVVSVTEDTIYPCNGVAEAA